LSSLAVGGAGGAAAVEPSLEDLCAAFYETDCGQEGVIAPSYMVCSGVMYTGEPAVAVAVADCITALSLADQCDSAKVAACFTSLEGKGCVKESSAPACAAIKAREGCDAIDLATCEKIADLVGADGYEGFTACMNPTEEGWYDPDFTGTCAQRLENCAGVKIAL
jgi:hypothetical protein